MLFIGKALANEIFVGNKIMGSMSVNIVNASIP